MLIVESTLKMGQISPVFAVDSGRAPIIGAYLRDDIAIADITLELSATQRSTRKMTGGSVVTSSTNYASVSDLAVPINRAGGYAFQYWLVYLTSVATEGIGVQLAFSGTSNAVCYSVEAYTDSSRREDLSTAFDFSTGLAPYTVGPGPVTAAIIQLRGSCNVLTVGTIDLQIRAETGGAEWAMLAYPSWAQVWSS